MTSADPWVLFEDMHAADGRGARHYRGLAGTAHCVDAASVEPFFRQIEAWHLAGLSVVLALDYEFGNLLESGTAPPPAGRTCAQALAFRACETGAPGQVEEWIGTVRRGEPGTGPQASVEAASLCPPAGIADLRAQIDHDEYRRRFERVHHYIRDGHTYQINLTFPLRFRWFGDPLDLYLRLRRRQRVSYGAYLELEGRTLVCLSPELFIRWQGDRIETRPMKGTRPRGADRQEDLLIGQRMKDDPKSRAENLMIVDLLRNDLGRICETGSVRVDSLFDIETFDTVLQMTSTVSGRLPRNTGLPALLRALFPCGSVTGAPKHRSRQIIQEIEARPRGIYTGSIGYLDPDGTLLLNVSIRTLELEADGSGTLGIGGGIVADSTLLDEWEECFIKARFLVGADPGFSLIETMLANIAAGNDADDAAAGLPAGGIFDVIPDSIPLWPLHAERLRHSAEHFGFSYDWGRIARAVQQELNRLAPGRHRLRLLLDKSGRPTLSSQALLPMATPGARPRAGLSHQIIRSDAWHQSHKTTFRPLYDEALRRAEREGLWDLLFFNERNELVEGARSCVLLRLDGRLLTPPLSSGALPGVGRARLLADPAQGVREAILTRSDLARADAVFLCNAVRGLFEVDLA